MDYLETEMLRNMSDKEIRRAQKLVQLQIGIAHKQQNTRALDKLHQWDGWYADEMYRRHFVQA
jgi:hypothetical protein